MSPQKDINKKNNFHNSIEHIFEADNLIAIIIRSNYKKEGIEFFTPPNFSQQLGYMNRPKGHKIKPHIHNKVERTINLTQEVLYIKTGLVRIDFYNENKNYMKSKILKSGDVILLSMGGHGFEMIEDSEIIEVKQGPFAGNIDKSRFESISSQNINIE